MIHLVSDCTHLTRCPKLVVRISETFSKVRDELGLYSNVEKAKRPTFHEIRRLSAKLIDEMGVNPRQRMAHASDRTTQIYTDSHDVEWHEVPAISVAI
ncbi:tyrosine-type recombinase/integrase [Vibrio parahaemolyticus]|nr:tyrosine-type recombinase/integrase [Vibrio parahaemolyticus]MDF5541884.1 tyrosine-type recombinase/integrase [Vibrio parahaemolyticus]MDF5624928.1 tyrosine-type recombinase/integrase [Vibrio parahaemolyticus]ODX92211.1 hypothetical protein BBM92_04380 [Vibrio parahaemolyticus]ODY17888.1 hypothetical protein BBM15_04110 [Vibrio parahaemolyticus]